MRYTAESLPLNKWPAADLSAWQAACLPSQRLRPGGGARRMKVKVQDSHRRAYGYLLDHCARLALLERDAEVATHVRADVLESFLKDIAGRVSSVSQWSYIRRIRRVAEIIAPSRDLTWLREIEADLREDARPRPKHHRIVDSSVLLALGLSLIERGEQATNRTRLQRARLVRDGLMIALLAVCPIRLKNLHSLSVGQQMRRQQESWWIVLDGSETKTGRPDERPIPGILTMHIDRWLGLWKPLFLDPDNAFWASTKGGAMAYTYVGTRITEVTRRELGVTVNPHLFRDCAVFTVTHEIGNKMGIASGLLQHTDFRTTEKYYNRGKMVQAVQRYQAVVEDMD